MSFRALVKAREGAYFVEQSKAAVSRLKEKIGDEVSTSEPASASGSKDLEEAKADVLPEILGHSLPLQISKQAESSIRSDSSLAEATALVSHNKVSLPPHHASNPVEDIISLPPVSFNPSRKWNLPSETLTIHASTANDMREDPIVLDSSEEEEAYQEGYMMIGKAFMAATGIVFGGAALVGTMLAYKYELHSGEDIKREGRNFMQPKVKAFEKGLLNFMLPKVKALEESLTPFKNWIDRYCKKGSTDS